MIRTEILDFDELTERHPDKADEYYCGEDDQYLVVYIDDELFSVESDRMEPEDARFTRSLSWVADLVEDAYNRGYHDATNGF